MAYHYIQPRTEQLSLCEGHGAAVNFPHQDSNERLGKSFEWQSRSGQMWTLFIIFHSCSSF
jgi:hypothetical protein